MPTVKTEEKRIAAEIVIAAITTNEGSYAALNIHGEKDSVKQQAEKLADAYKIIYEAVSNPST